MHGMQPPLRAMASVFLVPVFLPSNPAWHLPPFSSGSNLVQGSKKKRHRAPSFRGMCVSAPNSMLPVCFPLLFHPPHLRRPRLAPLIAPQRSVRSLFSPFSSQRVRKGMSGEGGGGQKKRGALRRAGIHQALKISFGFFFYRQSCQIGKFRGAEKRRKKKAFSCPFPHPNIGTDGAEWGQKRRGKVFFFRRFDRPRGGEEDEERTEDEGLAKGISGGVGVGEEKLGYVRLLWRAEDGRVP